MHYNNYYYCRVISGVALCSCPYRYYLQSDNKTCLDFYALCNIKNCYSYSYCNIVYGNAICSCPYGYYLQSDKRTCLIDPCHNKGCYSPKYCSLVADPNKLCELKRCDFNLCQVVSGKAVCFCPSGYYLQQNGLSCTYGHSTKLSGAFIVLIVFGVIFCVFLFAFFCAIYLRGKRKFDPVTVQFYATTQSAVVQGAAQNHLNSVDFQIGVNNTIDSNILYPSNEIEIDNVAHFNMAPPPYELLEQSLSLILSTESPPEYSN
ncbi:uncharacterized protein LOC136083664 [Hydra vulgaris]|uniref:Uncharacterized protein LOC136083664 n=1 Tax=Hydra vulgaris TaxID=6087 RepID=A0ABM4CC72_HYDVU